MGQPLPSLFIYLLFRLLNEVDVITLSEKVLYIKKKSKQF